MKQIYRVLFPTDKIFIGIDASGHPQTIDVDNSELLEADFAALPKAQQADYSLQKTILWESENCSDELLSQKQREFIHHYQADNPAMGYNILSETASTPLGAESWSIGVDGCKAGWFFVASYGQHFKLGVVRHIEELFSLFAQIRAITIDIPIGLQIVLRHSPNATTTRESIEPSI